MRMSIIAALSAAALGLAEPAGATALDGPWCRDDGQTLTVAGDRVTTGDGRRFSGYVVEPAAGPPGLPHLLPILGLDRQLPPEGSSTRVVPDTALGLRDDGALRLLGFDFSAPPVSRPP